MIAIIGDLHFGIKSGDRKFLAFQADYIKRFVNDCIANGITTIVQAGDFFDSRKSTDNYVMHEVIKLMDYVMNKGIVWHNIVGNHDIFHRNDNSITPLDVLARLYDNFYTHKQITDISLYGIEVCLIPWLDENNMSKLEESVAKSQAKIAIGHLALDGFAMYKHSIAKHGLSKSIFSKFDAVYTGHYHTISMDSNIIYIGSPYHLNWADYEDGNMRGWFKIDDYYKAEFMQNTDDDSLFSMLTYDCNHPYEKEDLQGVRGKIITITINEKSTERHYKNFLGLVNEVGVIDYRVIDNTEAIVVEATPTTEQDKSLSVLEAFKLYSNNDDVVELANQVYERACI